MSCCFPSLFRYRECVGRRTREGYREPGGFKPLFYHPPLWQKKKKKKKCLKNESLALLTQLHHLPFTSQPTAIWLPSRWPHSDCSNADVASGFPLAESSDPFLGPLLPDLSADWTGWGSRGSDLSAHGDWLGEMGPGKAAQVRAQWVPGRRFSSSLIDFGYGGVYSRCC